MSKKADKTEISYQDICQVAHQFVRDNGYGACHFAGGPSGISRMEDGERVYYLCVEARKGPSATRKTQMEHLIVQVRLSGIAHKTLRISFVTTPPDALRGWLPS